MSRQSVEARCNALRQNCTDPDRNPRRVQRNAQRIDSRLGANVSLCSVIDRISWMHSCGITWMFRGRNSKYAWIYVWINEQHFQGFKHPQVHTIPFLPFLAKLIHLHSVSLCESAAWAGLKRHSSQHKNLRATRMVVVVTGKSLSTHGGINQPLQGLLYIIRCFSP